MCWLKNHIYKLIPEHQVVPTSVSFTEKTAFIKKKKKKKKSLPTLPNSFGVLTLNTHIFLFGPTKPAKHFEKMAEMNRPVYLTRIDLRHWKM